MRVFLAIFVAVFSALFTVAGYLIILDSSPAPAWLMVALAVAAVAATIGSAKFFAWNDPRTASRRLSRPPWWLVLLLSVVIASGPFLGRLVAAIPLLTMVFTLGTAAVLGLALYSIRRDWPRKQAKGDSQEGREGDTVVRAR